MSATDLNWLIMLIIDIFSIILGIIGIVTAPIISLFGVIISLTVIGVQIMNGQVDNALILSFSIASMVISALCFAVAWSKK